MSERVFDLLYEQGFEITRPVMIKRRYWVSENGKRSSRGILRQYIAIDHRRGRKVLVKLVEDAGENVRHILGADLEEHPNVMVVYDAGNLGKAGQFAAVDYVEGQDVSDWFSAAKKRTLQKGYDLALQLFAGLNHLHSNRIVHGDIHGDNIRITPGGTLKILDLNAPHSKLIVRDEQQLPDIYRGGRLAFQLLCAGEDVYTANRVFEKFDEDRDRTKAFLLQVAGGDAVLAEALYDFFRKVTILTTDRREGFRSMKDVLRDFTALKERVAAVPAGRRTERAALPFTGQLMSAESYERYRTLAVKLAPGIVSETDVGILQDNMPKDSVWSDYKYTGDELLSLIRGDFPGGSR